MSFASKLGVLCGSAAVATTPVCRFTVPRTPSFGRCALAAVAEITGLAHEAVNKAPTTGETDSTTSSADRRAGT